MIRNLSLGALCILPFFTINAKAVQFAPAVTNTPPYSPWRLAVADINKDNKLDLLVLGKYSGASAFVTIYLGTGDGSFNLHTNYGILGDPYDLAVKDLNQDGNLDLIVAYNTNYCLSFGQSDGSFAAQTCYLVDGQPVDITIADYDSDGIEDLICPGSTMSVRTGLGNGLFGSKTNYHVAGGDSRLVAFHDFDGDGLMDVIRSMDAPSASSILRINKGSEPGVYTNHMELAVSFRPERFSVADFNNNGHLDVLLVASSQPLLLVTNDGHANFSVALSNTLARSYLLSQPAIADFDGDGLIDLALTYYNGSQSADVFINLGGSFSSPVTNAIGDLAGAIVSGDFDGDGRPDLITASYSPPRIYYLRNLSKPTLQIHYNGGQVRVIWPNWNAFDLYTTESLAPPINWELRTIGITTVEETKQLSLEPTAPQVFLKLMEQAN
ncbi:MAG: VCBS repeat-containing protein [Verrucomicrobia bacterium]|nr:VCBS repeat-containing protein [Verrucomicrobiota bacterium]